MKRSHHATPKALQNAGAACYAVVKRADDLWAVQRVIRGSRGRLKRQHVGYFASEREAEEVARDLSRGVTS